MVSKQSEGGMEVKRGGCEQIVRIQFTSIKQLDKSLIRKTSENVYNTRVFKLSVALTKRGFIKR